jgi:hypothetical protein
MLREYGAQRIGTMRAHQAGDGIQHGSERLVPQDHLQNLASFAFTQTLAFDYPSLLDQPRCKSGFTAPVTTLNDPISPGRTGHRENSGQQFGRCPQMQAVNEPVHKQISLMPLM